MSTPCNRPHMAPHMAVHKRSYMAPPKTPQMAPHKSPQRAVRQSDLQRHLQTLMDHREINSPIVNSPIIYDANPTDPSVQHVYNDSRTEVDAFRGNLLGVEDELIDALVGKQLPSRIVNDLPFEAPKRSHPNPQPESELWKGRLLGVEDGVIEALATPGDQRLSYSAPVSRPRDCSRSSSGSCGSGASDTAVCNTWGGYRFVGYEDMPGGHGKGEGEGDVSPPDDYMLVDGTPSSTEHSTTDHSTPETPPFYHPSTPNQGPDPPGAGAGAIAHKPDNIVVDSMILERPENISLIGWHTSDWQDVGSTVNDLLAVKRWRQREAKLGSIAPKTGGVRKRKQSNDCGF